MVYMKEVFKFPAYMVIRFSLIFIFVQMYIAVKLVTHFSYCHNLKHFVIMSVYVQISQNENILKSNMAEKLRFDISQGKAVGERRFYINFPQVTDHRNHALFYVCVPGPCLLVVLP